MKTHTSAKDVAEYLVWLAAHECEADPDYLTPLKLQKLLYFVQGWAFAEWDSPMFRERIEAWQHGPVVPEVFCEYRGQERRPIMPRDDGLPPLAHTLHPSEQALIRAVWDAYKRHSAFALRDLTHAEVPWLSAYAPDASGRCSNVIDPDAIRRSFKARAEAASHRLGANRDRLRMLAARNTRTLVGRDVL